MKDFKFIQVQVSDPSHGRPSEHSMPSRVAELQNDGYTIENVSVSNPVLSSTSTTIRDAWQKAENSYVVIITYTLAKEISKKKGIYD